MRPFLTIAALTVLVVLVEALPADHKDVVQEHRLLKQQTMTRCDPPEIGCHPVTHKVTIKTVCVVCNEGEGCRTTEDTQELDEC
ncbi:MAG: hypothetical protein J3R72DRAFT_460459 [Linnemannia gamsii]|nr:MAG: hypothetical protein J3R72DRAFT_460459 [Linnemannia gamsii]